MTGWRSQRWAGLHARVPHGCHQRSRDELHDPLACADVSVASGASGAWFAAQLVLRMPELTLAASASSPTPSNQTAPTILIVGASRGLGHAMVAEFVKKGWHVVGAVRDRATRTPLHDLAEDAAGRVEI